MTVLPSAAVARQPVGFDYGTVEQDAAVLMRKVAETVRSKQSRIIEDIADIGDNLLVVKQKVGHGHFLAWIAAEFGFSDDTARNYMRVAAAFGDKLRTVRNLPPALVYKLAAPSTPAEVRDQVVSRSDAGEPLPVKTVVNLIETGRAAAKEAAAEAKRSPEGRARRARQLELHRKRLEKERLAYDSAKAKEEREAKDIAAELVALVEPEILKRIIGAVADGPRGWKVRATILDMLDNGGAA